MKLSLVDTVAKLNEMTLRLASLPLFAFDTETTGLDWTRNQVFMLSFSDGEIAWVVPRNKFTDKQIADSLKIMLREPRKQVIAHNIKFDAHHVMASFGVYMDRRWHDTLIMAHMLNENRSNRLKDLMVTELNMPADDEAKIHAWMKENQGAQSNWDFSKVPEDMMIPYSGMDTYACFKLFEKLKPQIDAHFQELYETDRDVLKILWKLEQNGVKVDAERLKAYVDDHEYQRVEALKNLFAEAKCEFNPDSPIELEKLFFTDLKLPIKFVTNKGKPSTNDDALLAMDHPVANLLRKYRKLSNGLNYAKGLLDKQDSHGYVHGDYSMTKTKTGRFSCSEPNLQNVPKDVELRACFIADENYDMFYFDHSQIEMVGFAHYSKDPKMVAALKSGRDLHSLAASEIYGVPMDKVTKDQRAVGKGTNFSIIYGVGKRKLATYINGYMSSDNKLTDVEAQAFKERYFERFPSIPRFQHQAQDAVKTNRMPWGHYIKNQFGRVRRIQDPIAKAYTAVNHLIQGWAPDLMRKGMVKIEQNWSPKWRQNVHDELRIDIPKRLKIAERRDMIEAIVATLTNFPEVRVPVGCKIEWSATNWSEIRKWGE